MTSTQKTILAILSVIACVLLGFVARDGYRLYQFYAKQPLGPALALPESTPLTLATNPSSAYVIPSVTPASTAPAPTNTSAPRCGGPNVMTILVLGTDARADSYQYGLADVIRVVRVDFATPKVTVLEFPRDLWVEIPDIADDLNGQDHEKLNQAYLYGNPGFGYTDDPAQGPGLMARTLQINFGIRADHYGAVNMRTFENIVNAVGGIDVTLEEAVDGRTATDRNERLLFTAGKHHLNGQEALMLARIRIEGTFARAENQDIVLCALRDKLTQPDVITKIPDLINSFKDNVQTDLSVEQLGQLACLGAQLPPENILFASFPEELFKSTRVYDPVFKKNVFVWDVDFGVLRDYAARFNAGTWPAPSTAIAKDTDAAPSFVCP